MRLVLASSLLASLLLPACGGEKPVGDDPLKNDSGDASFNPEIADPDSATKPEAATDGPEVSTEICTPACSSESECLGGKCVSKQPPCRSDDECQNDTYCDVAAGKCLPYGAGKLNNPACRASIPPGLFVPAERCSFRVAPATDAFPEFMNVLATPVVATFDKGGRPAIVAPFYDKIDEKKDGNGILRVLSGTDCRQSFQLGQLGTEKIYVSATSSVAVGDLDGDGLPEIVAYSKPTDTTSGMIAFTKRGGTWSILWRGKNADGTPWVLPSGEEAAGPSIHDLDDDGKPEIIRAGWVFDNTGKVVAKPPKGFVPIGYGTGQFAVMADIDGDGNVELVNGVAIYRFNPLKSDWDIVVDNIPLQDSKTAAFTALADFGTVGPLSGTKHSFEIGKLDGKAEIIAVYGGRVYIINLFGEIVWGPVQLPGSVGGGPPTVADFDGDGQPEIAIAGDNSFTVLDPDCLAASVRVGGTCKTKRTDGWLWSKRSQDRSGYSGSSVFDFDADGLPEVIYSDECFTRIYKGDSGDVLFSQYHSSATWLENPIVADTNLDDRAELVIPSNLNGGVGKEGKACGAGILDFPDKTRTSLGVDYVFAGLRCKQNGDCVSGKCDGGLCRCTSDDQCCTGRDGAKCVEAGYVCVPPGAGVSGGNTCRATHPHGRAGITVYRDDADRWVKSRSIWNQHAYSITNVNDDGTIPKTSKWLENWKEPKLNDYRKNSPGDGEPSIAPDLTARASTSVCSGGKLTLNVTICNRGAAKASDNYSATFYEDSGSEAGRVICSVRSDKTLEVAECDTLSCEWIGPPRAVSKDVKVIIDAEGRVRQCNRNNKTSTIKSVKCEGAG